MTAAGGSLPGEQGRLVERPASPVATAAGLAEARARLAGTAPRPGIVPEPVAERDQGVLELEEVADDAG